MSPRVSIIITAYEPKAKPYLDKCVESVRNLSYDNFETIIVGRPDYLPEYEGVRTIAPSKMDFWNGEGMNFGAKAACPNNGGFFFFINDDVILTKDSLKRLVAGWFKLYYAGARPGQLMPCGNDMQGRYFIPALTEGQKNYFSMNAFLGAEEDAFVFAETLCMYATLIPRSVWQLVGPFDETLRGQDDIDYSLRIRMAGLLNAIDLSAVVWHHGGRSAQYTLNDEKRKIAREIFNKKWQGIYQV